EPIVAEESAEEELSFEEFSAQIDAEDDLSLLQATEESAEEDIDLSFEELSQQNNADEDGLSLEWEEDVQADLPATDLASQIDELETLLQYEEEPEGTIESIPENENDRAETLVQSEEEEHASLSSDSPVDAIDELETLLQYEEEPEGTIESIPENENDRAETLAQSEEEEQASLSSDSPVDAIDELETLLQDEEELERTIGYPTTANNDNQPETLTQLTESEEPESNIADEVVNDSVVEDLITLLQTEQEPVEESEILIDWGAIENDDYPENLGSMWQEANEQDMEEILADEQPSPQEQEYDYAVNLEDNGEYYEAEQNDYNEDFTNYDQDEDSPIDEIITAFQTEGTSNSQEMEYEYEEEEQPNTYEQQDYMNQNYDQIPDWEASYDDQQVEYHQQEEADDYEEWQSGVNNNNFEVDVDLDDEDSIIDEIVTTFQFGQDNPSTQVVIDEEADAMVTKWQQTEDKDPIEDSGMIDWEKIASGGTSHLKTPEPDFESFTVGNDPMETAIRAKKVLEKSKTSLKDSIDFDKDEQDSSLPPLPPISPVRPTRTEIKPPSAIAMPTFADEYYEEEQFQSRSQTSNTSSRRKNGIILEDDTDLPYRTQLKNKGGSRTFDDVEDSDWGDLLDDIPPVSDDMFGISEQTAARYADSGVPPQFNSQSFQMGDTQPANLATTNSSHSVSQTAPTFPETPPASVRVQQFFENNGRVILQIGLKIAIVVVPIGLLWLIFSIPSVNKRATVMGLHLRVWKDVRGKNLRSVVLKGKDLSGIDFSGADLSGSDLGEANLRGAKLRGAKLQKTNLKGAKLNLADFTQADLSGANLTNAEISQTIFREANLSSTKLEGRKWAPDNPPVSDKKTKCANGKPGPCRF
ncbi:MAG: hypothetical protein CV045_06450, partial [Cyanobacteria bacterium M5B4]